jgi:chromosome segregation ATPase
MSTTGDDVAALREQINDLQQTVTEQAAIIERQTDTTDEQAERIDRLLQERAEDRKRITELEEELSEYRENNEHDKATIRQQVSSSQSAGGESDESGAESDGSMTPMERLLEMGEAGVAATVTASVERAKAIAAHFGQWASKTPKGLVVKANLKTLLETAAEERLAWKQVYRAARTLEKFTKGAIRFEKHRRHGWMLVAEPGIVSQLGQTGAAAEARQSSSVNGG